MFDPENTPHAIARLGTAAVEIDWFGEGLFGEYNPQDPEDQPMLRFTVFNHGEALDNGSFCTQIPATVGNDVAEAAAWQVLFTVSRCLYAPNRKQALQIDSWLNEDHLVLNDGRPVMPTRGDFTSMLNVSIRVAVTNASNDGGDPGVWVTYKSAIDAVDQLLKKPNDIPADIQAAASEVVASASNENCEGDYTMVEGIERLQNAFNTKRPVSFQVSTMSDHEPETVPAP